MLVCIKYGCLIYGIAGFTSKPERVREGKTWNFKWLIKFDYLTVRQLLMCQNISFVTCRATVVNHEYNVVAYYYVHIFSTYSKVIKDISFVMKILEFLRKIICDKTLHHLARHCNIKKYPQEELASKYFHEPHSLWEIFDGEYHEHSLREYYIMRACMCTWWLHSHGKHHHNYSAVTPELNLQRARSLWTYNQDFS